MGAERGLTGTTSADAKPGSGPAPLMKGSHQLCISPRGNVNGVRPDPLQPPTQDAQSSDAPATVFHSNESTARDASCKTAKPYHVLTSMEQTPNTDLQWDAPRPRDARIGPVALTLQCLTKPIGATDDPTPALERVVPACTSANPPVCSSCA